MNAISRKVSILFGGDDGERFVSIATAAHLSSYFNFDRYIFLRNSSYYLVSRELVLSHIIDFKTEFNIVSTKDRLNFDKLASIIEHDVVFIALHGKFGEDGTIQALFDDKLIKYTGSDTATCKLAFNKRSAKLLATKHNIAVPKELKIEDLRIIKSIVAKPTCGGSSIGIEFDNDIKNIEKKVLDPSYLVEERVIGREFSCTAVEEKHIRVALLPLEIIESKYFDYGAKYLSCEENEIIPSDADSCLINLIERTALELHIYFGCKGYSRSDFIYCNKTLYFLELNTHPGISSKSILTKALYNKGISIKDFIINQISITDS